MPIQESSNQTTVQKYTSKSNDPVIQESKPNNNAKKNFKQNGAGKLSIDPNYFQSTIGSLSNSIADRYSTNVSNKPGSVS
jgi:hypothetical protein